MKRQVYENITRNFDIFEFLDENVTHNQDARTVGQANGEGDDEMSDELEFQIDDDENRMESYYFETANGIPNNGPRNLRSGGGQGGILDLDDGDEEGFCHLLEIESAENARPLKRGST